MNSLCTVFLFLFAHLRQFLIDMNKIDKTTFVAYETNQLSFT